MAKKTINQALKDLFLGLGGDPSALADNTSASDYIADLESAIKAAATAELPTPEAEDIGKIVSVVSDGDEGAEYDLATPASDVVYINVTISDSTVTPPEGVTKDTIIALIRAGKQVILCNKASNGLSTYYNLDILNETQYLTTLRFVNLYKKTNTLANTIEVIHKAIDMMTPNSWSLSEVTIYSSTLS